MTIYVITNLEMNHNPNNMESHRRLPIDTRFLDTKHPYAFYLTDQRSSLDSHSANTEHIIAKNGLHGAQCSLIWESELDPTLHQVGKEHLAEWSFLLAEEKHSFCSYPFFMLSSRFYMKNEWLLTDLDQQWDQLFSYFSNYSHGFLPSYCRPMRWVKFSSLISNPRVFFPFTSHFFHLVEDLFRIRIPEDYPIFPDLGCHYLGFKDRQALLNYVSFYKPILNFFFHENFSLKNDISSYVKKSGEYPNEKPLTFVLETLSHLYFQEKSQKFFTLHYNGYYELDFCSKKIRRLKKFKIPFFVAILRSIKWHNWWFTTEGPYRHVYKMMLLVRRLYKQVCKQ